MRACLLAALALPLCAQTAPALGSEAFFKQDPKTAMVACTEKARTIEGKDSRMLAEYGRVYLLAGDRAKAEDAFRRGVADDPKDGETYRLIARAWLMAGQPKEALEAIDLMQKVDPKATSVFAKAGVDLVDHGFIAEGQALMLKSMDLAGAARDAYQRPALFGDFAFNRDAIDASQAILFGRAYLRAKHSEEAAWWFHKAVETKPKEEKVWNAIALALASGGTVE